jgi:hypothetical protein
MSRVGTIQESAAIASPREIALSCVTWLATTIRMAIPGIVRSESATAPMTASTAPRKNPASRASATPTATPMNPAMRPILTV